MFCLKKCCFCFAPLFIKVLVCEIITRKFGSITRVFSQDFNVHFCGGEVYPRLQFLEGVTLQFLGRVARAYSSSLLRAIIARNHLPFFKILSNFEHFCRNFQIFCPFLTFFPLILPFFRKIALMTLLSRKGPGELKGYQLFEGNWPKRRAYFFWGVQTPVLCFWIRIWWNLSIKSRDNAKILKINIGFNYRLPYRN